MYIWTTSSITVSVQDVIDKFGPRLESEYQQFIENRDN